MSWSHAAIGDVVRVARSGIAPEEIADGTTYVGLEHIDSSGEFVEVKAVDAGELASSKFRFTRQHVLFGKLRPYLKKTARPNFEGVCSTDILPLEPTRHIDRDYLFHVLRRQSFVDEVSSLCAGANLPRISPKVLASMRIPMPPLSEQRRIAVILDKADTLRVKRREVIAKLDQLLQAVFLDMFGDPVANTKAWRVESLDHVVAELKRGPFGGALKKEIFVPSGYCVYEQQHAIEGDFSSVRYFIDSDKYREMQGFSVSPSDLIVSCSGTMGRVAVVPAGARPGVINQALLRITPNAAVLQGEVLADVLRCGSMQAHLFGISRGSGLKNFPPMSDVRELQIICPPVDLQKKYLELKTKLLAIREKSTVPGLDRMFAALQQSAFSTGL